MNAETHADPEALLRLARARDGPARGQLLELYRNYLTLLARLQLGRPAPRVTTRANSAPATSRLPGRRGPRPRPPPRPPTPAPPRPPRRRNRPCPPRTHASSRPWRSTSTPWKRAAPRTCGGSCV